jgi:hypothetical protein
MRNRCFTAIPCSFPVFAGLPVDEEPLQLSVGDGQVTRFTEAVVQGKRVVVKFKYRWNEPPPHTLRNDVSLDFNCNSNKTLIPV